MKTNILIIAFTLAGLVGMAQTNQPLPPDAQPLTALTYLSPSDSTVWLYNERSSLAINVGVWADVVELFETGWSNTQIDSAITANLADYIPLSQKGAANGVATLDINSKVLMAQIPDALVGSVNYQGNYNAATNIPALPASPGAATKGHYYVVSTGGTRFGETFVSGDWIISNGSAWQKVDNNNAVTSVNGKVGAVTLNADDVGASQPGDNVSDFTNDAGYLTSGDLPAPPVTSVNSMTGAVVLAPTDLGLGNVDNTSDANKPVSTSQQAALDGKEPIFSKGSLVAGTGVTLSGTIANRLVGGGNVTINAANSLTASSGIQITTGNIAPVYGTAANTIAQGNDSRINNGQTAFGWGDYRQFGLDALNFSNTLDLNGLMSTPTKFIHSQPAAPVGAYSGASYPLGFHFSRSETVEGQLFINGLNSDVMAFRRKSDATTWSPWRYVWHDGNFNPSDYIPLTQKGTANGVATLDGSGKVPFSQLPTSNPYKGTWNASTNAPTIANGTGTTGDYYRVSVAGTQNLGSGSITFAVGDDVIYNGSIWQRVPSGISATNLALGTRTSTTIPVTNSNGTGFTLPVATTTLAGLLSGADKVKLNSAITEESDPTVAGHIKSITAGNIANWNTSFGWGDYRQFGLGSTSSAGFVINDDMNAPILPSLFASTTQNPANSPTGMNYPMGVHIKRSEVVQSQLGIGFNNTGIAFRSTETGGTWGAWRYVWHDGNFNPSNYLLASNFTWAGLPGKPTVFSPSPHTHNASDIDAGTLAAARIGNATVDNAKLSNMAANTIKGRITTTGAPQDLTALQVRTLINVANGATANNTDAYLLSRTNHTGAQAISTVTGLQAALDGKALATRSIISGDHLFGGGNLTSDRTLSVRFTADSYVKDSENNPRLYFGATSSSAGIVFRASAPGQLFQFRDNANTSVWTIGDTGELLSGTVPFARLTGAVPNTRQINGKALSANVTLTNADIGSEPAFTKNTGFNKNFGTSAGTVSEGNHTHAFSTITGKPTTISGYGITDAVPLTGNATISGTKTFSSPVVAPQYQGTSTSASSSIPTNAQSLFTASVSSNTSYTLTNLSGSPRHIQVVVTNTGGSDIFITFNGAKLSVSQSNRVDVGHTGIFTFLINNGSAYGTKTLFQND